MRGHGDALLRLPCLLLSTFVLSVATACPARATPQQAGLADPQETPSARADTTPYRARHAGRNRVEAAAFAE